MNFRRYGVNKLISKVASLIIVVLIAFVAIVGGYAALQFANSSEPSSNSGLQPLPATFMLDFVPLGYHGLFYYGYDHGIYARNGIDLTIEAGHGSVTTIEAVAAGKVDFGFADPSALIVGSLTSNVSNVRIISAVFQRTFLGIVYNKANISKISDLAGKKIASFQGNGAQKLFTVFGQVNHLNLSSVSYVYTAASEFNSLVALGQADAYIGGIDGMVNIAPIAAQHNIQLGDFLYADNGLPIYGHVLVTTMQMISSHPDLVQRFVKATLESVIAAGQHPNDAITSLVKYNTQLQTNISLADFELTVQTAIPNVNSSTYVSNPLRLGCVNSSRMQTTINIVTEGYGINAQLSPSNLYTNEFVSCS